MEESERRGREGGRAPGRHVDVVLHQRRPKIAHLFLRPSVPKCLGKLSIWSCLFRRRRKFGASRAATQAQAWQGPWRFSRGRGTDEESESQVVSAAWPGHPAEAAEEAQEREERNLHPCDSELLRVLLDPRVHSFLQHLLRMWRALRRVQQ